MKILTTIRAAIHWVQRMMLRYRSIDDSDTPLVASKAKKRRSKEDGLDAEKYGAHYYLGSLLDDLDGVFQHLPKLRTADRDAYHIYSRLGATIVPENSEACAWPEPHIMQSLPAFGCVYVGRERKYTGAEKRYPVRFLYMMKVKRPHHVQPALGTIYRVGATVDLGSGKKAGYVGCYVAVAPDASDVTLLKEKVERVYTPRSGPFVRIEWGYPEDLKGLAEDNDESVEDCAIELFSWVANMAYAREAGMTVTASNGKRSAVFAIEMLRTPYFFKDREKVVNENGATKRIFHLVSAHTRTLAGGQKKLIKPHFRGLRNFTWQGYSVSIDMVGRTAQGLSSFGAAGLDIDQLEVGGKYLTATQVGEKIKGQVA